MAAIPQHRSKTRAIALVLNTVWLILGISLGLWFPPGGLIQLYLWGLLGGAIALITGTWATQQVLRQYRYQGIQDITAVLVAIGVLHLFCFNGLLVNVLPSYYAGLGQPDQPISLTLADIPAQLPSLPAYVRIEGYVQPELAVTGSHQIPRNHRTNTSPRTISVTWLPIVAADWQPSSPVTLMAERQALPRNLTATQLVTVTGLLFPLSPKRGERFVPADMMLYLSRDGVGVREDWLRSQARFNLASAPVYLLRSVTPQPLRTSLIIIVGLLLAYLSGLVWLCFK